MVQEVNMNGLGIGIFNFWIGKAKLRMTSPQKCLENHWGNSLSLEGIPFWLIMYPQ